jgi:hypothetical protein
MEAPFGVSSKLSLSAANHKRNSFSPRAIERCDPNRQICRQMAHPKARRFPWGH